MQKTILATLSFLLMIFSSSVFANYLHNRAAFHQSQCIELASLSLKGLYQVECRRDFQHFYPVNVRFQKRSKKNIQIANFNVFHPGMGKTRFKDYRLLAALINKWDVTSAVELLPTLGADFKANERIVAFLQTAPQEINELEARATGASSQSVKNRYIQKLNQMKQEYSNALKAYRTPGYIKILFELRKLDPSWALILSPWAEAYRLTDVSELVGFFYRARNVTPIPNEFCAQLNLEQDNKVACYPDFSEHTIGVNANSLFSRRPFMASFKAGNFDFTMLATHTVFTSPRDSEKMQELLMSAFGVETLEELNEPGVNLATYARFAEMKFTLDFMKFYKSRYREKDVILAGDLNLESNNPYWLTLLPNYSSDAQIYINRPTTLTDGKYDINGNPTYGVASNYDHFIYDNSNTYECGRHGVDYFYQYSIGRWVQNEYLIRTNDTHGPYTMPEGAEQKINRIAGLYDQYSRSKKTVSRNRLVWDNYKYEENKQKLLSRLFYSQLQDATYYKVYSELISDHFPIRMTCSTLRDDD